MEESTKKHLRTAAPIAAGLGAYLLARKPIGGMIKKVYGKHYEPVIVKNPSYEKPEGKSLKDRIEHNINRKFGIGHFEGVKAKSQGTMPEAVKNVKPNKLLLGLEATPDPNTFNLPKVKGQLRATQNTDPEGRLILDKLRHGQKLHAHGMGPETRAFTKSQISVIKKTHVNNLPKVLDKMFGIASRRQIGGPSPENAYLVKPRSDFLEHLGGSQGGEDIHNLFPGEEPNKQTLNLIKKYPEQYIIQHRQAMPKYELSSEAGEPHIKEFRVSALNGKIMNISHRHSGQFGKPGSKFFNYKKYKEIEPLIKKHHKLFQPKNKITPISYDIAYLKPEHDPTAKARPQIIEANLGVSGGEWDQRNISRKMYKTLTGRSPHYEAAAKGLATGGLTHLGLKKLYDERQKS